MVRHISPLRKEPQEISYKSINLNPWLEEDELVNDTWVYAYTQAPQAFEDLDASQAEYLKVEADNKNSEDRLLQKKWDRVKYRVHEKSIEEITDEVISESPTGGEPNKRVHKDNPGKFRIGIKKTQRNSFLVVFKFTTDKGRKELVLFGVGR